MNISLSKIFLEEVDIPETLPSSTPVIPEVNGSLVREELIRLSDDLSKTKKDVETLTENLDLKISELTKNLSSFTNGLIQTKVDTVTKVI